LAGSEGADRYSSMSVGGLIDALQEIDQQTYGLHGTLYIVGFAADDSTPGFGGGVIGSPPPVAFGQFRELVQRGVDALPELLKHIDDARPTKLVVGNKGFQFMFAYFGEEYDPRDPKAGKLSFGAGSRKELSLPYTVRIGDVCFSIIGEITSRTLLALRYQHTAGLIVNSPVESAALAARVRADWTGIDSSALKGILVEEAMSSEGGWGGLPQLRLYFPEEYRKLKAGPLKSKCEVYEARLHTSNQLPDPTSPSVTPRADARVAPSVTADH